MLIAEGEHPKVIQARLGHSSIQVTLDTYGHLFEGPDEAAADRLDAAFARDSSESSSRFGAETVVNLVRKPGRLDIERPLAALQPAISSSRQRYVSVMP